MLKAVIKGYTNHSKCSQVGLIHLLGMERKDDQGRLERGEKSLDGFKVVVYHMKEAATVCAKALRPERTVWSEGYLSTFLKS